MRSRILPFVLAFSIVAWFECSSPAEPPQSAGKTTKTKNAAHGEKPKPDDVLRRMADYLGNLKAFSCRIDFNISVKAKGMDTHITTKQTVRLERPSRLALILEEGQMGVTLISDGKNLVQYMPGMKRYSVSEAPADLAELESSGAARMPIMGAMLIPTSGDRFYKSLMDGVTKSDYLGTEKIGDIEYHHCRFEQKNFDWDIWIATGDKPLPHKVVPDLSKQFAKAGGAMKDAKMEYTVAFSDWNTAPKFRDADFAFTPPADAEKVDSLFGGRGDEEERPHPLLGQPAPAFQTVDLDEHPFDLKKHLGKEVILLDFWATWCGPCVEALPKVDAAAKKFADKGLIFRAVNCGEEAATIKEFLTSSKLDSPVAMDSKNEIAPAYKVEGIPQTVLIGKDGKVQVVHVGYSEEIGDALTKEIEDLLAGKDLAGPELKKFEEAHKKKAEREAAKQKAASKPNGGSAKSDKDEKPQ